MKRKSALTVLVFLFLTFLTPLIVRGQDEVKDEDTAFEKAYKEYQGQIAEYNSSHVDYVLRRSQYLRFKTLQSQQDAFNATSKMLQERDDVVISYLNAFKEKLAESVGLDGAVRGALIVQIDSEIGWFTDHKNKIPSAGTLEDLVSDSNLARDRFKFYGDNVFYESLATMSSGRITDFDERLGDIFVELKKKVDEIKTDDREEYRLSSEQLQQLERWIFEADTRILRSQEKHNDAKVIMSTFITQRGGSFQIYGNVMFRLNEAQQFLKDSGNYLTEIVRSIKTKED